ncbi:LamG-like jellyroll fold domain-containing protein [Fodinicola feengrottensis]|uniref:LamG-like jellyroll fold domain-containing protein n=1 Tax=Fodinicola feengrottensis TaxID=435914 RepID=UPI0031DA92E9
MDLTLVRAGDGSVSAAAAPTSVVFSGGGSGPLVRIGTGTANVALSWPGGSLPAPSLSGDMATYPNVLPDVDLRLTADVDGYTEVLVVKTLTAASNPALKALRFGLAATGVSTVKDRAGDIDFRDGNGNVVFHAPTPTMWDSPSAPSKQSPTATDPPATEPDRVAMGVDVSASALTITPNQAMLTGTGTQFPVYLDPSVSAGRRAWTSVWAKFPTTSYWNSSENVARVGHVSEQGDVETNRSFFWLATDPVNGKHILSATLRVTNAYSYSCTARPVDLWLTGAITSSTTWNSQPSWMRKLGSVNAAKGYDSSCPAGELEYNALSAIQQQAAAGWPGVTVGLRAADESDSYGWKKFTASNTAIVIEYNTVPAAPTSMSVSENKPCVIGADRPTIGTATPTVYATMRDADAGQNLRARFQWWTTNSVLKGEYLTSLQNPVNTVFQAQVPAGMYADGGDISWRVRAEDGTDVGPFSTWCEYHVDATHPEHSPTVASTQFPTGGQLGNGVGRTGTFTFGPNGEVGVVRYAYAVNSTTMDVNRSVPATGLGMFGALAYTPTTHRDNFLMVWTLDAANNPSPPTQYFFVVDEPTPVSGQWLLNDGSGSTAADSSAGGGHPLSLPASGTSWAAGREAGGVAFAGGVATTGGSVVDSAKPVTVSAWVSLSNVSVSSAVVGLGGSRTTALSLQYAAGSHSWVLRSTSADTDTATVTSATGGPAPVAGVWTHLVGLYDPGADGAAQLRLYVNGVLAGSAAVSAVWTAGGGVRVGGDLQAGANVLLLQGSVDDVRVWDRVLTDAEIAASATEAVLVGRWGFDEGTGSTAADASGYGKAATLSNAAWIERPPGFALDANGTNSFAATSGSVLRTDGSYTVTAWARLANASKFAGVVSQDGSVSSGFILQYEQDTNQWSYVIPTKDATSPPLVRVNSSAPAFDAGGPLEWVFLTVVYDAPHKQLRLYVNGNTTPDTNGNGGPTVMPAPATMWNATGSLHIGASRYNSVVTNYWPGQIDDVRAYSGVLTDDQIYGIFTGSA